jgi:NADPH:quinone reductase-like Zn-dependent oxidoreductase
MRAVVHDSYGPPDVLRLEEVERPVPEEDEVLVRIHATTVKGSGAHAEFVCMRESAPLERKPAGMTFEEAAAVCDGASLALACLRKGSIVSVAPKSSPHSSATSSH